MQFNPYPVNSFLFMMRQVSHNIHLISFSFITDAIDNEENSHFYRYPKLDSFKVFNKNTILEMPQSLQDQRWEQAEDRLLKFINAKKIVNSQLFSLYRIRLFSKKLHDLILLPDPQNHQKYAIFDLIDSIYRIWDKTTDEQRAWKEDFQLKKAQTIQKYFKINEFYDKKTIKWAQRPVLLISNAFLLNFHAQIILKELTLKIYQLRHTLFDESSQKRTEIGALIQELQVRIKSLDETKCQEDWKKYQREVNLLKASIQTQKQNKQGIENLIANSHRLRQPFEK